MAGKSSRFFNAGYTDFKYKLTAGGKSLFTHSLETFKDYFSNATFYFGYIGKYVDKDFLIKELLKIGVVNYHLIDLEVDTSGQAESVYKILKNINDNKKIVIFNIDTKIGYFEYSNNLSLKDGYVEVFEGEGDHWSFIKLDKNNNITEVTEKKRISNLCSNGLYVFKNKSIFIETYDSLYGTGRLINNETFIMPMYGTLLKSKNIGYKLVDINTHDFFGTPSEYDNFKTKIEK
jgi:hypothetical protein